VLVHNEQESQLLSCISVPPDSDGLSRHRRQRYGAPALARVTAGSVEPVARPGHR